MSGYRVRVSDELYRLLHAEAFEAGRSIELVLRDLVFGGLATRRSRREPQNAATTLDHGGQSDRTAGSRHAMAG